EQCDLHGIQTAPIRTLGPIWNITEMRWEARPIKLPLFDERPILLVPKYIVRRDLTLRSQEFYNYHMIEYLKAEYDNSTDALAQSLRSRRGEITKRAVKERHPFVKDELARFVRNHPEVLEDYKKIKGAAGPLSNNDLNENFDEAVFSTAILRNLQ